MALEKLNSVVLILIILGANCVPGAAQQLHDSPLARILDSDDDTNVIPNRDDLENALQELKNQTDQLRSALVEKNASENGVGPSSSKLISEDDQKRMRDIHQRIELLKKIYREKLVENAQGSVPAILPGSPPNSAIEMPRSDGTNRPIIEPPISEMMDFEQTDATNSIQQDQAPPPTMSAERVLPQPVNIFEMGNSLFQTGNLSAALDAYQSVERSSLTAFDANWLDYMKACCHRRLGNFEDSEAAYREIANIKGSDHPIGSATWWLKYLESNLESKYRFAQLDDEIETLLKRAQSHVDGQK